MLSMILMAMTVTGAPPITAAAFAPEGRSVIVGSQAGLVIHSWPALKSQGTIKTEWANVHDLAFSQDGKLLLAAGGKPAEEGAIEIFAWTIGDRRSVITAGDDVVYAVDWRSDGQSFAAACGDRRVRLFDR